MKSMRDEIREKRNEWELKSERYDLRMDQASSEEQRRVFLALATAYGDCASALGEALALNDN